MTDSRVAELHRYLQWALELELFTIPPYLSALYSIREDRNWDAVHVIQGVVMEEMLHMTLVANIMNAIDGAPCLSPTIVQNSDDYQCSLQECSYPGQILPHSENKIDVPLARFSTSSIETFQKIEQPERWCACKDDEFTSIGQFYEVLKDKLITACTKLGEASVFTGDRDRQICADTHYYGAGGDVVSVCCLADAKSAIEQITQQGEGLRNISNLSGNQARFGQEKDRAHYFRFKEIVVGRKYQRDDNINAPPTGRPVSIDWDAVYPMQDNPSANGDFPECIGDLLKDFESSYRDLLHVLHRSFNGKKELLRDAVGAMYRLKYQVRALMKCPLGDGTKTTYGPPFWYLISRSKDKSKPKQNPLLTCQPKG